MLPREEISWGIHDCPLGGLVVFLAFQALSLNTFPSTYLRPYACVKSFSGGGFVGIFDTLLLKKKKKNTTGERENLLGICFLNSSHLTQSRYIYLLLPKTPPTPTHANDRSVPVSGDLHLDYP